MSTSYAQIIHREALELKDYATREQIVTLLLILIIYYLLLILIIYYLLLILIIYYLLNAVYLLYFHPLAKFRGPRRAAVSTWWIYLVSRSGQADKVFEELHRKYI
ncbi:hypothetical protein NW762_013906 [Fusarium torreyae]|uniref:Uncharacterized protein n=1 Tax=Fusarium torreyae TaxID=1237075 RepID=A0A9W8V9X4_9HYPO|nr:hypothetical protein NW762_013906 [Fusarium torreyae]